MIRLLTSLLPINRTRTGFARALCVAAPLLAAPAMATEFVVNTTAEVVDATVGDGVCRSLDGTCSLRAALSEASKTPAVTVHLPAGRYVVDAPLILSAGTTLVGEGPARTVIEAGPGLAGDRGRARVLQTEPGALSGHVTGLTVDAAGRAGAILVGRGSTLELVAVVVRNGRSRDDGPGIRAEGVLRAAAVSVLDGKISGRRGRGGGIHLEGAPAWLTDVTVVGNDAPAGGGIFVRGGALYGDRLHVVGNRGGAGVQTNPRGRIELHDSWLGATVTPNGRRRPDCIDNGGDRSSTTADSFVSRGGNRIDFRGVVRDAPPGGSSGGPAPAGDRRCGPPAAGDRFDLDDAAAVAVAPTRVTDEDGVVRVRRDDAAATGEAGAAVNTADTQEKNQPALVWAAVATVIGIALVLALRMQRRRRRLSR